MVDTTTFTTAVRMGQVEASRAPGSGIVALIAGHIGEQAGVEGWVGMAGRTVGGQVGKVIIDMAFRTFQAGMGTG